jgi:hypothetical protein
MVTNLHRAALPAIEISQPDVGNLDRIGISKPGVDNLDRGDIIFVIFI